MRLNLIYLSIANVLIIYIIQKIHSKMKQNIIFVKFGDRCYRTQNSPILLNLTFSLFPAPSFYKWWAESYSQQIQFSNFVLSYVRSITERFNICWEPLHVWAWGFIMFGLVSESLAGQVSLKLFSVVDTHHTPRDWCQIIYLLTERQILPTTKLGWTVLLVTSVGQRRIWDTLALFSLHGCL